MRRSERKLLRIWVDGDREQQSRLEERDYYIEETEEAEANIVSSSSSTYVLDSKTPRVHQLPVRHLGGETPKPFEPPHSSSSTQTYYPQPEPLNAAYLRQDSPVHVTTASNMPSDSARLYNNISLGLRLFILVSLSFCLIKLFLFSYWSLFH